MRIGIGIVALSTLAAVTASAQSINEDLKLTASDAAAEDRFGEAVAISGTTAIVGALGDEDAGIFSGSAYVFDTTTGQQLFKLTASDAAAEDNFGYSVAISGTTAIVGAQGDDDGGFNSGSAYVFDITTGQQLYKLTAADAAPDDFFGNSVSISGTTAIVGALWNNDAGSNSGSAYVFDITTGQQLFKLTASDAAPGDEFGTSVAISGTTAIVGAQGDDDAGIFSGSAYVFDTTTGQQLFKLTASDAALGDRFGWSVSISGPTAIVGAIFDGNSGSAYVFDTTTGQQLFKLTASDAAPDDLFGSSVAISGTTAIVGALGNDDGGSNSGSAYVFDTTTGQQLFKLTASDAAGSDQFGSSVAISGTAAIIGARYDDEFRGAAYVNKSIEVTEQPKTIIVNAGETASFSVAVSSLDTNVVYQWRRDGDDLTDGGNISGSQTATLQIVASTDDVAVYDCAVMNNLGVATSSGAILAVRSNPMCFGDANGDGVVDLADLNAVLAAFGQACP